MGILDRWRRWTGPDPPRWVRWATWIVPPLLLLAWVVAAAGLGRWPAGDGPHTLGVAVRLAQTWRALELWTFAGDAWSLQTPHPPGAYALPTAAYTLLGPGTPWAHLVASALALGLCWDGVRRLNGGWVGLLFLICSGLVWSQAESHGVDLATAACVVQAISHLAASERLERTRPAVAWGAWMGAAFLTKYSAPMFLIGPCVLAALWVVRGRRWRQLGLAFAAFLAVAGLWYAAHLGEVLHYVTSAKQVNTDPLFQNTPVATGSWLSGERLGWYPLAALDAFGWAGAAALLIGALGGRRRAGTPPGTWALAALAVVGGWWILSGPLPRQDRYWLPALPLLAALAGTCRWRWALAPVAAITLVCTAAVYLSPAAVPEARRYVHSWQQPGTSWPWPHEAYRPASLDPSRWRVDEALHRLREEHGSDGGTVGLLLHDRNPGPGFGLLLLRSGALGYRWQLATVRIPDAPPAPGTKGYTVLLGPFRERETDVEAFDVLLTFLQAHDERRMAWLRASGLTLVEDWRLGGAWQAGVFRRAPAADPAARAAPN